MATYTVKSGDSLGAIASRNGMSLSQLLALNPQFQSNPNLVKIGQTVNLSSPQAAPQSTPLVFSAVPNQPAPLSVPISTSTQTSTQPYVAPNQPAAQPAQAAPSIDVNGYKNLLKNGTLSGEQVRASIASQVREQFYGPKMRVDENTEKNYQAALNSALGNIFNGIGDVVYGGQAGSYDSQGNFIKKSTTNIISNVSNQGTSTKTGATVNPANVQLTPQQQIAMGNKFDIYTGQPLQQPQQQNQSPTGNQQLDDILQALQGHLTDYLSMGYQINPSLNIDPATVQKYLDQATTEIHPYYAQQIQAVKDDLTRSNALLQQQYETGVQNNLQQFKESVASERENAAGGGTVFSGQRGYNENNMLNAQNRTLSLNQSQTQQAAMNAAREAEKQVGSSNMAGYNAPALSSYSASLYGPRGGFDTQSPGGGYYTPGSFNIGSLPANENYSTRSYANLLQQQGYSRAANNPPNFSSLNT